MGLNETYSHVRSDILLKIESPSVNQAYSTVVQEESQRLFGVVDSTKDPLIMLVGKAQNYKGKKPLLGTPCEICGYKNYLIADYYRLVMYPPDFKSKWKPLSTGNSYQAAQHYNGLNNSRSGIFNHAGTQVTLDLMPIM